MKLLSKGGDRAFRRRLAYSYARVGYRISVGSSGAASVFRSGMDFKSATKQTRGFPTGALSPTSYIERIVSDPGFLLGSGDLTMRAVTPDRRERPLAR